MAQHVEFEYINSSNIFYHGILSFFPTIFEVSPSIVSTSSTSILVTVTTKYCLYCFLFEKFLVFYHCVPNPLKIGAGNVVARQTFRNFQLVFQSHSLFSTSKFQLDVFISADLGNSIGPTKRLFIN